MTSIGIQSFEELALVGGDSGAPEVREISIAYRQGQRLQDLARALAGEGPSATKPGTEEEIWPLLGEGLRGEALGHWLSSRIVEIERALGRLPSVAIFVDDECRIDETVALVKPFLAAHNIPVVGCHGRVVGDQSEVRVFDLRHVKGLEFEAAFMVGVDQLAERMPELFDRFVYVGITRAATYLGITCERELPAKLAGVRKHFRSGGWE